MTFDKSFFQELLDFIRFLYQYTKSRLIIFGVNFEKVKDVFISFLVVRRGKYSQSFLNMSFFLLVSAVLIGGPVIAENNPLIADYFAEKEGTGEGTLVADIYTMPFETTISQKPRDSIIEYQVEGGDTLESIAKKFDVSIDTIKWVNNLKGELIKPEQTLKIPPVTGVVHKVASGETIYSIAKKYRTEAQNIVNFPFNDFADLDTFALSVGQTLYVPDGVIEEAKPIIKPGLMPQIAAGQPGGGNFIWPTSGSITQYPVWYHMAVDIANNAAPAILASDGGVVVSAGCIRYGYGCSIVIDHGNGYQTLYAHLSQIGVSVGQSVSRGARIGQMGSTGRSSGTHLHFEVRSGGRLLNPLNFLK